MKSCNNNYQWNLDFDSLSDEEFETLLEHADSCGHHARLLDEYNNCLAPLIREVMSERILLVSSEEITLSRTWMSLVYLKLQKATSILSAWLEWKLASASLFMGIIIILLIDGELTLAGIFSAHANLINQPIFILIEVFTIGLLIFIFFRGLRKFSFANVIGLSAMSMLWVDNYMDTSFFGKAPEKCQPRDLTVEEKEISSELKKIIAAGFTVDNCQKGLELLKRNEALVRHSWMNTLNKAKLLIGIGERDEPRRIIGTVLEEYSGSREAVGSAYEALSWLEEVEYNEEGKADPQKLDRRIYYIKKGLQFYPEYYLLWIDAFEIACLKKNPEAAIVYLNKVIKIDRGIAKQYFLSSSMTAEMKKLSFKLKMKITWLTMEKKIMKQLRSVKIQNLTLGLLIALSWLTGFPIEAGGIQSERIISEKDAGGLQKAAPAKEAGGLQKT